MMMVVNDFPFSEGRGNRGQTSSNDGLSIMEMELETHFDVASDENLLAPSTAEEYDDPLSLSRLLSFISSVYCLSVGRSQ